MEFCDDFEVYVNFLMSASESPIRSISFNLSVYLIEICRLSLSDVLLFLLSEV